jgi:hypothetical protein
MESKKIPAGKNSYQPHGPFIFTGGRKLSPVQVGTAMSIVGVIGIVLQSLVYPKFNDKYGIPPQYRVFVYRFPIAYLFAPYLAILPSSSSAQNQPVGRLFG